MRRDSGLREGQAWCGGWVAHTYDRAAAAEGGDYTRSRQLLSDGDARRHFLYQRGDGTVNEQLRDRQAAEGSQRRYITLANPGEAANTPRQGTNHEVYDDPHNLPIRPGDTVIMNGHVAMVQSYNAENGTVRILEGNAGRNTDRVDNSRVVHLTQEHTTRNRRGQATRLGRDAIQGFGRPALGDFQGLRPQGQGTQAAR